LTFPFDRRKVTMPSSSECYDEAGKSDAMAQGLTQKLDYDDRRLALNPLRV
jgi:hypothetical protein